MGFYLQHRRKSPGNVTTMKFILGETTILDRGNKMTIRETIEVARTAVSVALIVSAICVVAVICILINGTLP